MGEEKKEKGEEESVCMFIRFLKINLFIYLFIYGCLGSLLLYAGFL